MGLTAPLTHIPTQAMVPNPAPAGSDLGWVRQVLLTSLQQLQRRCHQTEQKVPYTQVLQLMCVCLETVQGKVTVITGYYIN